MCHPLPFLTLPPRPLGRHLPQPAPGASPLPLISATSSPSARSRTAPSRHGPLMALRLGTVTTIVASSADAAHDVLHRHDAAFSGRFLFDSTHVFAHYAHSMAWLPATSPRWRALRKLCSGEIFAPHRLDTNQSLRREKVRQLVSHVELLAREGAPIRIGRLAFTTALNLLSSTIFSVDLADLDDDRAGEEEFKNVLAEVNVAVGVPNLSDFFPEVAWLDLQGLRRRIEGMFLRLHTMIGDQIERRRRRRRPSGQELPGRAARLPRHRRWAGLQAPDAALVDFGLVQCGDGHNCRDSRVGNGRAASEPTVQVRARDELKQVLGSKQEIDESDIWQLKYLQAIVKETFHLHPPAPFLLPHVAETTTQVQGYTVPKGARILVNAWAIRNDGEVWPEPDKFMPERFMEKEVDFRGRDFELLPFGSGRRMCPGAPLATGMVHLMLASLLHRFHWRLPPDVENGLDMRERLGLNLDNCRLYPRQYKSAYCPLAYGVATGTIQP